VNKNDDDDDDVRNFKRWHRIAAHGEVDALNMPSCSRAENRKKKKSNVKLIDIEVSKFQAKIGTFSDSSTTDT